MSQYTSDGSGNESDEDTLPSWADQVANFPQRTAHTGMVQDWLELFLARRTFDDEEINEFLVEVRLDGKDLHTLSKNKLLDCLPKDPEETGVEGSTYRFEQMRRHLLTDIMRAREEVGIETAKVQKGPEVANVHKPVPVLRDVMIGFIVAFAIILIWGLSLAHGRD
ncbi:hypothetical protein PG985_000477 [Apiospora marii]|uniref:Uncharacterized protein n=1 Tax=Apiospora marii TaxID=335849 RepID=A0ABR1R286_9PEZI